MTDFEARATFLGVFVGVSILVVLGAYLLELREKRNKQKTKNTFKKL